MGSNPVKCTRASVAQLDGAGGFYPQGYRFESCPVYGFQAGSSNGQNGLLITG
jgi:hypothetical protein